MQAKLTPISSAIMEPAYYLERLFSHSDDQLSSAERIVDFCRKHKLADEGVIWIKKYADLCINTENPGRHFDNLLRIALSTNQVDLLKKTLMRVDNKQLIPDVVYKLISHKEYDAAESVLERMSDAESKNIKISDSHSIIITVV